MLVGMSWVLSLQRKGNGLPVMLMDEAACFTAAGMFNRSSKTRRRNTPSATLGRLYVSLRLFDTRRVHSCAVVVATVVGMRCEADSQTERLRLPKSRYSLVVVRSVPLSGIWKATGTTTSPRFLQVIPRVPEPSCMQSGGWSSSWDWDGTSCLTEKDERCQREWMGGGRSIFAH